MRVPLFWRVLPVYLLIVLVFAVPIMQRRASVAHAQKVGNQAQASISAKPPKANKIEGQPVRIVLPRLGIDLTVVPGNYNPGTVVWSVSNDSANYAVNTAKPNNKQDKTLIYGHWTQQVFGQTKNLVQGDIAYVYTTNNHIFEYRYESNTVIKPTDTTVFAGFKGKPGLVLMTCQGSWAQERRLMYFNMVRAS